MATAITMRPRAAVTPARPSEATKPDAGSQANFQSGFRVPVFFGGTPPKIVFAG